MKTVWVALSIGAALWAASVERPRVRRASLVPVEKIFDQRVTRLGDDPFLLLGATRGLYLDGYGAVFTAEVNLANVPTLNPFRQSISNEEMARVRHKKLERLPLLRQSMRETLAAAAASLDEVPPGENIVISVSLLFLSHEDSSGMPRQILMQATKGKLLDARLHGVPLDQIIRVQEE